MTPVAINDATQLAAIHADAFSSPWDASEITDVLNGPGAFGLMIEATGFILCRVIVDEAEVLTLAVGRRHRRNAVATTLLNGAVGVAALAGARSIFLEVAEDNSAARALYLGIGFAEVGQRPAYYTRATGAVAARVMRRDLNR